MKDYLNKVISDKTNKIADLQKRGEESQDVEEVKAIIAEVKELEVEITDAKEQLAKLDEEKIVEEEPETPVEEEPKEEPKEEEPEEKETEVEEEPKEEEEPTADEVKRSADWVKVDASNLKTVASFEQRGGKEMNENLEQRKAFMDAVQTGNLSALEKRADAYTTTGDLEYVIPENLINDIITEINNRGYILNLCNKTNYAVGQTIPVGLVNIVASWVGTTENPTGEGEGSAVQKGGVVSYITFANYKLRCVVGITHEAKIQSLPIFERKFVEQVAEAMVTAIEAAIVNGTGVSQPKGILTETPMEGKALEIATGADMKYADLVKFVGAVPAKYRKDAVIFCTQKTFFEFMAIEDSVGQPVARVNAGVDGAMKQYLFNTPVIFADEYLADYAKDVTEDTTFAFIYNFKEYTLNTNYNLGISQRQVWENENHETKAVLACDGKPITKYSYVTFTKKAING